MREINISPADTYIVVNKSIITKEVARKMANSLPGCPIVGYFNEEKDTITYKNIENNLISGSMDLDTIIATNGDEIKTSNFEPFTIRIYFE